MTTEQLDRALAGEPRWVARLLTLLEGAWSPEVAAAMQRLTPLAGRAQVIGVTGPPGVGKSTLVDRLVGELRNELSRIAVLAFDPSSPFTGGALLGDRIRMMGRGDDPGVFIRSVANRAHAGGLSRTASRLVTTLDAVGYDAILVETVGAGQSEVDVAGLADTVVVVLAPGFGDEIQALKAGMLETADLFVVNKADLPGADRVVASLHDATDGAMPHAVSAATGQGVAELTRAIRGHHACDRAALDARRAAHRRALLEEAVREQLWAHFRATHAEALDGAMAQVTAGATDPESAAAALLEEARNNG
jgi:LAO/AO transport system kinase